MKSKEGTQSIHPALVSVPIGAFTLALIGDLAHAFTAGLSSYRFAYFCMGIGIATALVAAVFGFLDYLGTAMSRRDQWTAMARMLLNIAGVGLYSLNFSLRSDNTAFGTERWPLVFAMEVTTFLVLGVSCWLVGRLAVGDEAGSVSTIVSDGADRPASG